MSSNDLKGYAGTQSDSKWYYASQARGNVRMQSQW